MIGPEKGQKVRSVPNGSISMGVLMNGIDMQVVLIHGLSVPSIIWQDVAPQLAASGFRVLIYGPSFPHRLHSTVSPTSRFHADHMHIFRHCITIPP